MQKDEIFFGSVLSFIIGIGCGSFFSPPLSLIVLLGSAFAVALLFIFPRLLILSIWGFLLIGCFGSSLALQERVHFSALLLPEEAVHGEVRVMNDPEERDFFRQTILHFEACESATCPQERILWQAPLLMDVTAGMRFDFSCSLELPKNFSLDFDYQMFLAKDGIGYMCAKATQAMPLPADISGRLLAGLYVPKHQLEQALSRILAEPEAGLAKGLLLGGSGYLPAELKTDFTRVGLSHMIAVSGYNITLIAQGLLWCGLFFGLWRKQALWAALVGIVFFIFMIGLPASAARAGAMAGIVFGALQAGRLARPESALLFAGGVLLFFSPLLLRYDLGFQLSFLATWGIVAVAPFQERFLAREFPGKSLVEVLTLTCAVELFVLPIILFSFHTFSPLIIVGNFLVILVPFAMAGAFLAALLFLVIPGAQVVVAWVAYTLLTIITRAVEWLGSFPQASINVMTFGVRELIIWYMILLGALFALGKYFLGKRYGEKI